MVTLRNTNKRRAAGPYNLPVEHYCADGEDRSDYVEMTVSDHNPETGDVGVRQLIKRINHSLRFTAGESKTGLPNTVVNCPEIAGAIARGELAVTKEAPRAPAPPPPAAPEAAPEPLPAPAEHPSP